ncbi:hypothetical protein Tco_0479500 [Tanacetum coccineum]
MEALRFADSHNMVAYLEKSTENADFDEIVDFLNANPIRYALTVFANMRRQGKDFSGTITPLFATMLIQPQAVEGEDETIHEERGESIERAATTAASLDAEQDSGNIIRTQSMTTLNEPIPQGTGSGSGPRHQDTILGDRPAQTRFERLSKQSNDPPLSRVNTHGSGEDRLKIMELMEICTKLSDKGRNIAESDHDEEISFVQEDVETRGRYDHDVDVTTASIPITTAGVSTLMKMKSEKLKEKLKEISKENGVSSETALRPTRGVTIQESSESRTRQPVPPPQHDPKDKGKAKIIKLEKPLKKKGQIQLDKEIAKRRTEELEDELEEEEKLARQREEEANLIS